MEVLENYYEHHLLLDKKDKERATHVLYYHPIFKIVQVESGRVFETAFEPCPSLFTYELSPEFRSTIDLKGQQPSVDPNTLVGAKALKIKECEEWNASSEVCGFLLNGEPFPAWLGTKERAELINSLTAAKVLGEEEETVGFAGMVLTLPVDAGLGMALKLQKYATATEVLKVKHLLAINSLESIEAVNAYGYKAGYPPKLNFPM